MTSLARPHDGGLAEVDLVVPFGHGALEAEQFAVFEEQHGVVAAKGPLEQPLGIVRARRHHDAQPGNVREDRVVAARMVRGGGVADADAATQEHRHLESAAAHVLHLRDLIEDLADAVEDEVGEHEIDDGSGAGHGGAGSQPDEAAFADRRVAEAHRPILLEQSGRGLEVAAAPADALAHHEDVGIARHLLGQGFERRLHEGDFSRRWRSRCGFHGWATASP